MNELERNLNFKCVAHTECVSCALLLGLFRYENMIHEQKLICVSMLCATESMTAAHEQATISMVTMCCQMCVCVCETHHRPCSSCWRIRSRIHIMSKQTYTHTHFLNGGPTNVIALRRHPNEMNDGLTSQSLHYLALPSHYTLNIRHNCMTFNNHQQTATCLYFIRAECLYIYTQGDSVSYINPFTTKSKLLKSITAISRSVVK